MRRSEPYSNSTPNNISRSSTGLGSPYESDLDRGQSTTTSKNQNRNKRSNRPGRWNDDREWDDDDVYDYDAATVTGEGNKTLLSSDSINPFVSFFLSLFREQYRRLLSNFRDSSKFNKAIKIVLTLSFLVIGVTLPIILSEKNNNVSGDFTRPSFVYESPYVTSSYYISTSSQETLESIDRIQVQPKKDQLAGKKAVGEKNFNRETKTRLAIVRPFCAFDAEPLPTTFAVWESIPPCRAAAYELGDEEFFDEDKNHRNGTSNKRFDDVGSHMLKNGKADLFLFYSQTYGDSAKAQKAVDTIIDAFNEPGGWSQCIENIYAIEANIPNDLDLYLPSEQENLYNWVNGPNRQYEAGFRIIQSGDWGDYDGFYLMEGDSIPIKTYWLDTLLSEIEANRPFAIMGAKYNGDKWDNFYEQIPLSLIDHTNGNAIYNTSHPLLDRLVGQLEVEAPCPYNSIPYDYRMSQMWIEGTMGIVPTLSKQIMLNEEGENITLSDSTAMFKKWADRWAPEHPFKETQVIHNYAATNLIPRHLGPEYIIHGAKLYSPWNPTKTEITLVVMEWQNNRAKHLLRNLDKKDHPFKEVVIMLPAILIDSEPVDYNNLTVVPTRGQHRTSSDFMDLCEAKVDTDWFMLTNSYHHVANHVDLMFKPGSFEPVIPYTPATVPFCFKYPYCNETVRLAKSFDPGTDKVVLDFDMLYHTKTRNKFCDEWKKKFGLEGEDLYKSQPNRFLLRKGKIIGPKGPTGTAYTSYLSANKMDGKMYKLIDRSLYGARAPFIKHFWKEEKLDAQTEEELAKQVGDMFANATDCNCFAFESKGACEGTSLGCRWRSLFESCHPPEMIDGGVPICSSTEAPTMSPTFWIDPKLDSTTAPTESPTASPVEPDKWYSRMFKTREHEDDLQEDNEYAEDEAQPPSITPG